MNVIKSAARVLDMLEMLSMQDGPVRLIDIAEHLDLPRSSTHGLLQTLVARGYVERSSGDGYELAAEFRDSAGWVGGRAALLRNQAMPIMERARDACGETLFLAMPGPDDSIRLIAKVLSNHPIRYDSTGRSSPPAYASVMGRVLLAHAAPDRVDAYFARTVLRPVTPATLTDEAAIRAILADIRARGYGTIEEEYAIGGCGVAAPVRNRSGSVVAVLDVATVVQRYAARKDEMIQTVLGAAAEISASLGYRPAEVA